MIFESMFDIIHTEVEHVKRAPKTANTISSNRQQAIVNYLKTHQSASVEDISKLLNLSAATVRREFVEMDRLGKIIRVYGGATIKNQEDAAITVASEQAYLTKSTTNVEAKKRMAKLAASLIPENATIFVNSGSSTNFFIEEVQQKTINIVTNNASAIPVSANANRAHILFLGGEYRKQSQSFVGPMAINALDEIYAAFTVLGTNGFSPSVGLTSTILQECTVNQKMVANTVGKVIVLADHSKIGFKSNFVSVPLNKVNILITDAALDPETVSKLEEVGIEIMIA